MFQMKEQDETPEKELSEVETGNLPEKEFTVMTVKMIKEHARRMDAQREKLEVFSKELENIKNNQEGTLPLCLGFLMSKRKGLNIL